MLKFFDRVWSEVPIVVVDVETTGLKPGVDRAVQVALVRFESGTEIGHLCSTVNPGIPIPAEATQIHGITDADVAHVGTIEQLFALGEARALLEDAQPLAFNAQFDRLFVPPGAFSDYHWPWLDPLTTVRVVDRFVRGQGRHKLTAACERHGVELDSAHDAKQDARAAGQLFYALTPKIDPAAQAWTLGRLIKWQREQEASEWFRFMDWMRRQPPRETVNG